MADVTISQLTQGKPSNSALMPYTEGGQTRSTLVANFGVPVGAVFHLATSTVPVGYLKCNGDTVPNGTGTVQGITADFSLLHATLGSIYGSAGKLPDLRGEFIRGFDDNKGIDPSRVIGSNQADDFKSHIHSLDNGNSPIAIAAGATAGTLGKMFQYAEQGFKPILPTGGTETRPRNVALMAVIKY